MLACGGRYINEIVPHLKTTRVLKENTFYINTMTVNHLHKFSIKMIQRTPISLNQLLSVLDLNLSGLVHIIRYLMQLHVATSTAKMRYLSIERSNTSSDVELQYLFLFYHRYNY